MSELKEHKPKVGKQKSYSEDQKNKRNFSFSDVPVRRNVSNLPNRSFSNNVATKNARSTKIAALRKQAIPTNKPAKKTLGEVAEPNSEIQNDSAKNNTIFKHRTDLYETHTNILADQRITARANKKPHRPTIIREWQSNVVKHSPRIIGVNNTSPPTNIRTVGAKGESKTPVCGISQDVEVMDVTSDDSDAERDTPLVMSLVSSSEKLQLSPFRRCSDPGDYKKTAKAKVHEVKPKANEPETLNCPEKIQQLLDTNNFVNTTERGNHKATVLLEQLGLAIAKYNDLKSDHDHLRSKLDDTKMKNQALQVECSESHYFIQRNHHLEKRVSELTNALLQKDVSFAKKEKDLISVERNTEFMQEKVLMLNAEIERLKYQLTEQENYVKQSEHIKQIDILKDLEIKFLHNQLIDIKGKIRVVARFKPEANDVFEFSSDDTLRINPSILTVDGRAKHITYNKVFDPKSTQEDIFQEVGPYITSAVDGYNVCLMTFGQTGSGKTYTMYGNKSNPGIITRVLPYILKVVDKRALWNYKYNLSIVQIYNETIMDLLSDKVSFLSLVDNGSTVIVKDLTEKTVTTDAEIQEFIHLGRRRRSTAKTIFNSESSRSHFIVSLRIYGESIEGARSTQGVLHLCDLAGFEKTSDLPIHSSEVHESKFIGKSLAGLARVLNALQRHEKCIPYRDCKLTHLLKPSLSGEAKCVLILTLSTRSENINASVRTLEMGQQALSISLGQVRKHFVNLSSGAGRREEAETTMRPGMSCRDPDSTYSRMASNNSNYPRARSQCNVKHNSPNML